MVYLAVIWLEENGTYSVMFPDLSGCFTMGDTLEEARVYAGEVLDLYLEDNPAKGFKHPSSHLEREDFKELADEYLEIYPVPVCKQKAFALKLRWLRQDLGLSQQALADRLAIGLYAYQRLENPKISNATLKTIEQVEHAMQQELVYI